MRQDIKEFIRTYSKAIFESNAAIFAGAGLSRPAGFVDWKGLLAEIADDLSLDIDKETDLISLAQYHVNERGRNKLNQLLMDEFLKDSTITGNHKILSRLPIHTYWTTNYDSLIEDALTNVGKRVDVKRTPKNLSLTLSNRQATVYKMHGDKTLPEEAVLTKDDYEGYNLTRKPFTLALQGDLIEKTFLFIGFSFDDPNLQYILSRIRILLGESQRNHYCFMKKVKRNDFPEGEEHDDDFRYAEIKQELRVKDLQRYRIQVLLIDDYTEITDILRMIEDKIKRSQVFVSGSASTYGDWGEERSLKFASELGKRLIANGNNLVSGFGLGVGSCIISGALEEIYSRPQGSVEHRLQARPFPQANTGEVILKDLWTRYREDMISKVGISIFIFGNKFDPRLGTFVNANGMLEEFEITIRSGAIPVPVGATGFAARKIWEMVMGDFSEFVPDEALKPMYERLGSTTDNDLELIEQIINLINILRGVGRRN